MRQRVGAVSRPVDEANLKGASLDEAEDDGARPAACAEHHRGTGIGTPTRPMLKDVRRDPWMSLLVPHSDPSDRTHDTTDGADLPSGVIDIVDDCKRALLVWIGEVAAGEPERRKRAERGLQPFRRNRERNVWTGEPGPLEEVIVEAGERECITGHPITPTNRNVSELKQVSGIRYQVSGVVQVSG